MSEMTVAIIGFFASATKNCNAVAQFIASATSLGKAAHELFKLFKRKKVTGSKRVIEFKDGIKDARENIIYDVESFSGDLVPIIEVKKPDYFNFTDVSRAIHETLMSSTPRTPAYNFLKVNTLEWVSYGCSIQSDCKSDVQLLLLIENEEANNMPVAVSDDFFEETYSSLLPNVLGHSVRITGPVVSINDPTAMAVIGAKNIEILRVAGCTSVIVPDINLVERMQIDFSFNPEVLFLRPSICFLGFLWVTYIDTYSMDICPIYEYGNIGSEDEFELLSDKLINQITFFKSKIWREKDVPAEERRYRIAIAYNDRLFAKISDHFNEIPFSKRRKEIITICRRWITNNAPQQTL